jgi:prophage regulatory protein
MAMLSKKQVVKRTGLSATTIWRQVRTGGFPKPRQLAPNRIGWVETEVQKWEESRPVGHCKVSINFKEEVE